MKIKELHETVSVDLPGVDCTDTDTEKFFPGFRDYANITDHGGFFDTFSEALAGTVDEGLDVFITFDYSEYEPGESAETDMPLAIYSVMVIKPQAEDKFDVVQFKPEQFTKGVNRTQLDALIRKLSKKLEHEEVELEFRVLGK